MIRKLIIAATLMSMAGCGGDGLGSQYSSARAQVAAPTYIPVTPGATPVLNSANGAAPGVLTAPVAVTPGAVPIDTRQTELQPTPAAVRTTPIAQPVQNRFARGPIFDACRGAGRENATRARCGCVQWVANQSLTPAQQTRGATYFTDQAELQDVRQSDRNSDERFWQAWSAFGENASQQCKGT